MRFASRLRNSRRPYALIALLNLAILSLAVGALVPPALSEDAATDWEYVVSFADRIVLYDENWQEVGRTEMELTKISSLIYDEIQDRIYITDMRTSEGSVSMLGRDPATRNYVFMGDLATKIHEKEKIRGITFDPLEQCLYWIDETFARIYKLDLKQPKAEPVVWHSFEHEKPQAISVDVCRRYLYWTTDNDNVTTIERNSLAGNKHQVLIKDRLQKPVSLEIDQFSDRMFWIDDHTGTQVSVESADLHGGDRTMIYEGANRDFRSLVVDEERMFIVDYTNMCVFGLGKSANSTLMKLKSFNRSPRGIIKRPRFLEKHRHDEICGSVVEQLEGHKESLTAAETKEVVKTVSNVICLNGQANAAGHCVCPTGWGGLHCEMKLCYNYCFNGKCAMASNGFPVCKCDRGFAGERCEIDRCNNYCLNSGHCELEGGEPVCRCSSAFSGRHCEMINSRPIICRAYCESQIVMPNINWSIEDECSCNNSTSSEPLCSIRSGPMTGSGFIYTIVAAALLTTTLLIVLVLGSIRRWYKPARPKIKKTYVVRKNVTPMTYRPTPTEQCEITIENCCNMQYCDTPCFDPKILVKDGDGKEVVTSTSSSKEDKRDLLSNMVLDNNDLF